MSRTDKDVPDWYAEYYDPFHRCWMGERRYRNYRDCDLPELTWANVRPNNGRRLKRYCEWQPHRPVERKKWYDDNPGWWYRMVWLEPERSRIRDTVRKAMQDYNANGLEDFEYDIADFHKKHNGGWYW